MRRLEELSPEEFEKEVRRVLSLTGRRLKSFTTAHLETIRGSDGEYTFDVTATFEALGADFLVLIECKHQKDAVKREVLQILRDKMQSVGAHKGMVFSTATFQSGAREYATSHRMALVHLTDSGLVYIRKGAGMSSDTGVPASWIAVPGEESFRTLDAEGLTVLHNELFSGQGDA